MTVPVPDDGQPAVDYAFLVDGMHCASCVNRIERKLGKVPGVVSVGVNLATREAHVRYQPGDVTPEQLRECVLGLGYTPVDIAESTEGMDEVDAARERAYKSNLRGLIIAAALTLPVFIISMFEIDFPGRNWLLLALSAPVVLWAGRGFFTLAWKGLKNRSADMNTLIAVGTGTAFLYSIVATVAPGFWASLGRHPHVYYEAATVITVLILFGRLLEERARVQTSGAIRELLGQQPRTARIIRDGQEVEIPTDRVIKGDILVIRPGERLPVDGVVTQGSSSIDESMITGESMPVERGPDQEVIGGTINKSGSFQYRATRVGKETALQQIVSLVQQAQASKPPIARFADVVSGYFVPVVIAIAVITFLVWLIFGPPPALTYALITFVSVLIIACPCALGLATPTAIMVGTGRGAQMGILIRDGAALETACKLTALVIDKTGTITQGEPRVTDVIPLRGIDELQLLHLAGSAEVGSEHPLGQAIVQYARSRAVQIASPELFRAIEGRGVEATIDGRVVAAGNVHYMKSIGIDTEGVHDELDRLSNGGKTPMLIARDGTLIGLVAVADTVKPSSVAAIAALHAMGLKTYMLTGDNRRTAEAVARQVGVDNVMAEVLPGQKADKVRELQEAGHLVGMVGDGINDAPALALANVGFAIGSGTDVAMEASDITLIHGDLAGVVKAIELSGRTMRTIKRNLFFAFVYNALGIPIAAGVLFPFFGILLNPMIASAAMAASSVSVVMSSLRLRKWNSG